MSDILKVNSIENSTCLNPAFDYGSAFSRGTRVEVDSPAGNVKLYFISGTASVNEGGKTVHSKNLEKQIERMNSNINGLLEHEGADLGNIVTSTTYVVPDELASAQQIIENEKYYEKLKSGVWIPADMCRDDLLIETDALAVQTSNVNEIDRQRFIDLYKQYHSQVMQGNLLEPSSVRLEWGVNYLFVTDFFVDTRNGTMTASDFAKGMRDLYKRVTELLGERGADWQNVVNVKVNVPFLLARPPDSTKLYYGHFNDDGRTPFFRDKKVKPHPSSTCVGTKIADSSMVIGMGVLAIYESK